MLKQESLEELSETERKYITSLSDEECATLSFVYHTIVENPIDDVIFLTDNELNKTYSISGERLITCAGAALGLREITELSVNGVINARTVGKALIKVGKRFLGYIGLAIAIYEFYNCIS